MNIQIQSLTAVLVDGIPSGGVVDALFHAAVAGNNEIRAPMLDALMKRDADAFDAAKAARDKLLKDTAHEATIARLTEEHKAALDSQKIASETALEALRVQLLEKHEAEMQTAADELTKTKAEFAAEEAGWNEEEKFLNSKLSQSIAERDALAAQLQTLVDGQTQLAKGAAERVNHANNELIKAQTALADARSANLEIVDSIAEAMRPAAEKAAAARQADLAAARARVAELEAKA